ncbi:MAG: ligase-associated DNA damage response endonuclease PdeM [Roseiflexus sp.]
MLTDQIEPSCSLAGEDVWLLPERALFWKRTATLIIADPHIGKPGAFRAAAIAAPEGTTIADLERLSTAIRRCSAQRLIVLGDLLHARSGRTTTTMTTFEEWRVHHSSLDIVLVRGNHDTRAGDPPHSWRVTCVDEPWEIEPFTLRHYPESHAAGYTLAGHLHPAVRLSGAGKQRLILPCFWFGARVGVLPAFGSFTGTKVIAPAPDDRVFVIADDRVVAVSGATGGMASVQPVPRR